MIYFDVLNLAFVIIAIIIIIINWSTSDGQVNAPNSDSNKLTQDLKFTVTHIISGGRTRLSRMSCDDMALGEYEKKLFQADYDEELNKWSNTDSESQFIFP